MKEVMASRALQVKEHRQVLPYNSRKGAFKVVESTDGETLYSFVAIFNGSD